MSVMDPGDLGPPTSKETVKVTVKEIYDRLAGIGILASRPWGGRLCGHGGGVDGLGEHFGLGRDPALVHQAEDRQDQQQAGAGEGRDRADQGDLADLPNP